MDEIAQETERTMSFQIQKALLMFLNEYADLYVVLD